MTGADSPLAALGQAGVSVWLDDLSRGRLESGSLARLIAEQHVVGVTTNPSIFAKAVAGGGAEYAPQLAQLKAAGADADTAVRDVTVSDVQAACDVFRPVFEASGGVDGRVSIEVDPRLAHDTAGTVADARALYAAVDRTNVMIKVPATLAGLPAVTTLIGEGISVNCTLIFGVDRYRAVLAAWAGGLVAARDAGLDLSSIHSVASFFVSRVDTAVDAMLRAHEDPAAASLLGTAAIANARLAWQAFDDFRAGDLWSSLSASGAHVQRPLWASTGVKDPAYDDTRYVVELVARPCVNTMPAATLDAVADHGRITGDTITPHLADAAEVWARLAALGVDYDAVVGELETAGVAQFIDAWHDLLGTVSTALAG
ncbi:MAG: transaldolase [Actinomycetales bacterium]|nr:transaldolase [Actinomycetales bacterium]